MRKHIEDTIYTIVNEGEVIFTSESMDEAESKLEALHEEDEEWVRQEYGLTDPDAIAVQAGYEGDYAGAEIISITDDDFDDNGDYIGSEDIDATIDDFV